MKIDGGCHCGNITYRADVDPDDVIICHCTDCQTLSGSAFRTVVHADEAGFELLNSAPKIYVKTAESGAEREQAFCPECGTQIYATSVGAGPRRLGLRVGTISQRNELPPKAQYWCRSAQSWVSEIGAIERAG